MPAITVTRFQGRLLLGSTASITKRFFSIRMRNEFSSRRGLIASARCSQAPIDEKAPLGVLPRQRAAFDWAEDLPPRPESDAIIYELHVKGFTKNPNSGVHPSRAGTYAGLIEKIPYLKELGITVVELMPIFQRDPHEGDYWGYMPLNFFAPHAQYASSVDDDGQHLEFKNMVKAFHKAGISVVLDVVYNHTCEGDHSRPYL